MLSLIADWLWNQKIQGLSFSSSGTAGSFKMPQMQMKDMPVLQPWSTSKCVSASSAPKEIQDRFFLGKFERQASDEDGWDQVVLVGDWSGAGKRLRSSVGLSDCGNQRASCILHTICTMCTMWIWQFTVTSCEQNTWFREVLLWSTVVISSENKVLLSRGVVVQEGEVLLSTRCEKAMRELVRK